MQNEFWNEYYALGQTLEYYKCYRLSSSFWNRALSVISLIGTGGGIVAWYGLKKYEVFWAVIVGLFTILQFACPFLKFADQIAPLTFAINDIQDLYDKMSRTWTEIEYFHLSDKRVQKKLNKYQNELKQIEKKYLSGLDIKPVNRFAKRAQQQNEAHFAYHHNIKPSDYERSSQ